MLFIFFLLMPALVLVFSQNAVVHMKIFVTGTAKAYRKTVVNTLNRLGWPAEESGSTAMGESSLLKHSHALIIDCSEDFRGKHQKPVLILIPGENVQGSYSEVMNVLTDVFAQLETKAVADSTPHTCLLQVSDLKWLTCNSPSPLCQHFRFNKPYARINIPFPPEKGKGWLNISHIGPSASFWQAEYHAPSSSSSQGPFELADIHTKLRETALIIFSVIKGNMKFTDKSGRSTILNPTMALFQWAEQLDYRLGLDPAENTKSGKICLSQSLLFDTIGVKETNNLLQCLSLDTSSQLAIHSVPKDFFDLFFNCIPDHHPVSTQKKLELKSRIFDLLAALWEYRKDRQYGVRKNSPAITMNQLYKKLSSSGYEQVSQQQLECEFNTSARALNDAFKRQYGTTIKQFLHAKRMQKARRDLLENSSSIKAIAYKCGYSHVNHFITAFKKYFGYTPGSLLQ